MIGTAQEIVRWLFDQDREKQFEVKEYHPKRSLNANAYAWALITKISDAVRKNKDEVYLEMLKAYGQSELVSVRSEINVSAYFKYYEKAGTSKLGEKNFTHYRIYKGSSEYDTLEMSILIDGIVQEAENLGIQTLTPAELERLKSLWNQS